jgi:hypothetical protein
MNRAVTSYPASGYRHRESGALGETGSSGFFRSSAVTDASSYALRFLSTYVGPSYNSNRAGSFSVRCVQHLLLFEKLNLLYG